MPSLILQRTSNKCKTLEIKSYVKRRFNLWKNKDVEGLLNETRAIQKRLPQRQKPETTEEKPKIFAKFVLEGKVNAAIRLPDDDTSSEVLTLSADVIKTLRQKHPNAKPSDDTVMLHGPFNHVNEIIFDGINADLVRPSGLDANFWSKILCNSTFGNASDDLCHAIALLAQILCSEELVGPKSIEGLVACRLIPLDKSPGFRPIGVGEVLRRIIGKAILAGLKSNILNVTGYQQLCAGLESGCEVADHAVVDLFEEDTTHGFIQLDASNTFNSINRTLLLHNVKILCPEIATYIDNCYMKPSRLFITGGKEISSNEGTNQGDPIAMGMYALCLIVCSYHVTYALQSESTLYSCLNVKELLARSRREI